MEKALVDFAAAQVGTTPVAISKARPHKSPRGACRAGNGLPATLTLPAGFRARGARGLRRGGATCRLRSSDIICF